MSYSRRTPHILLAWLVAILLVGSALLGVVTPALAWDDCPRGEEECAYPGACSRYVDTDDNGICDHSESSPTTSSSSTIPSGGDGDSGTSAVVSPDDGSSAGDGSTGGSPPAGSSAGDGSTGGSSTAVSSTGHVVATEYNFGLIAAVLLVVYGVSFALYKTRRIRVVTHRRVWNLLLLVTFLMTGILGMLLTIRLNYGLPFDLPFSMLFWHVEAGVAMTIISMFHVAWHVRYYAACLFPSRRRADRRPSARTASRPVSQPVSPADAGATVSPHWVVDRTEYCTEPDVS